MIDGRGFRWWLLGFALCVVSVVVSVSYFDRRTAEFFDTSIRHTELWNWLNRLLAPFVMIPAVAILFLLGSGCWLLSGRRPGIWASKLLICSWSAIWALATEFVFKQIFGRAWPDPDYIENHLYGFRFLQGTPGWTSFPSGTATIAAATVTTAWLVAPRSRLPGVLLAVFLCVAVVVTNGHWVSDVIAGVFLGISIGWMTVLLIPTGSSNGIDACDNVQFREDANSHDY